MKEIFSAKKRIEQRMNNPTVPIHGLSHKVLGHNLNRTSAKKLKKNGDLED